MGNYCSSKQKDSNGSDEYKKFVRPKKNRKKTDKSSNVVGEKCKNANTPATTTTDMTNNNAEQTNDEEFQGVRTIDCHQPYRPAENSIVKVEIPENSYAYKLPDELKCVSDDIKKLLLGVPDPNADQKSNKIVVYVCFPDNRGFAHERTYLHEKLMPAVRSKCTESGYELHVVDLNCDRDQEHTCRCPDVDINELRRQRRIGHVVPLLFVDDSLGTPVLPKKITKQDYEVAKSRSEISKLLDKWYCLDENNKNYLLKDETAFESTAETREQDKKLLCDEKIQMQMSMLKYLGVKFRAGYFERVFQHDIYNEIVLRNVLAKKSVWIVKNHGSNSNNSKNTAMELKKRLEQLSKHLKTELPESNIIIYEDVNNEEFTKKNTAVLLSIVDSILKDSNKPEATYGVDTSLLQELRVQNAYGCNMTKMIINRESLIDNMKKYLTSSKTVYPLVVYGPPGCGKTTILSFVAQHSHIWNQNAATVVRYVNASVRSSTLEQTLSSVAMQLNFLNSGKSTWFKHDVYLYSEHIKSLLISIGAKRPIVLIIDGIDQFKNSNVGWVTSKLPKNVKVIVSTTETSPQFERLRQQSVPAEAFIQIPYLTEQQSNALTSLLTTKDIAKNKHFYNGLHMTPLKQKTCMFLPYTTKVVDWIDAFFHGMETLLGREKVSITIGLLCATRYGLLDSEATQMLTSENEFDVNDKDKSSSVAMFWAEFNELFSILLFWFKTEKYATVRWSNSIIAEAAARRYDSYVQLSRPKLLSYFEDKSLGTTSSSLNNSLSNRRRLDECTYLMDESNVISRCFDNLNWILDMLNNGLVMQLLDNLSDYSDNPQASFLNKFLSTATPALMHNGYQLYSQMSLYKPTEEKYRTLIETPPFPTLMPLIPDTDTSSKITFDVVKRLAEDSTYVITVSTKQQELGVWDVHTCKRVRTLRGIPHPSAIKMIDNHRCIVLCERKLAVIDLATGKVLSKLKGVMNQNMPYFDLHSPTKLVALARSRMHVSLIDIETDTIEAYFKAGEDRFLNSLLVSGNGRVMVCGDETQKPFPLLVWNLTSRQLMYDLRIPYHEFITCLAAITHEGHFVCCVAQEVDEPGPNFIVVYDLQSGTLFKKWKPGVNCVALDISSKDSCVLSGHENGQICIWDLTTGNCRWTLGGHMAPVTSLRLDPRGGSFISLDTHTRDRTIKLWNVTTGELVSEFTPAKPITAFDILPGGQFVVVASSDSSYPTVLQLKGPSVGAPIPQKSVYSEESLDVNLSLAFREDDR
ncbi:uncharacterized protein LOC126847425 [Adelges cooleyi]|uniref:uncharacterized protein LOC126847425 n=1 Tax=Adelges cooleyi TaxID=133065 RepID=UPI00218015D2|nr:uncharacterized protein LOC126847425 [Adelges cooleyi]